METYEILTVFFASLVPASIMVGFYIALRIDIEKLKVIIQTLINDISEIKTDIKEICSKPKN